MCCPSLSLAIITYLVVADKIEGLEVHIEDEEPSLRVVTCLEEALVSI